MNNKQFKEELKKINIELTSYQLEQLETYYQMLIDTNKNMNLTAITKKEDVYLKHFYDSITLSQVIDLKKEKTLCDIGSGAGFPGIVLKICFPNLQITLVDALNKRVNFLNNVIETLKLEKINAIHERAEIYARSHIEEYDIVTSRAVAKLNVLLEYGIPMLKVEGYFIAMKGNIQEEIILSKNALTVLNAQIILQKEILLPIENSNRTLLKIQKKAPTGANYPRNFDKISKKPL